MMINNKNGYILVDVLLAIAIMGVIVTLVFPMMSGIFKRTNIARSEMLASYVMQNTVESTYAAIATERNWNNINPNQPFYPEADYIDRKWELRNGVQNNYEDIFTRRVEFHDVCRNTIDNGTEIDCESGGVVDPNTRRMVATLEWVDENGKDQARTLELLVSKYIR